MLKKQNTVNQQKDNFPRTFLRSFWLVFTLPFRALGFIFRRLAEVPIKNLLLMAVIFVALVMITMVVFLEATSQPKFCVSCHYMKPYFASWENSSHKGIHCTLCHFEPGVKGTFRGKFTAIAMVANYFTGVYRKSKPWAEISDESCLREGCHQTRLLEGKVPFKEGIIFDHTPHLTEDRRGKNLRCTSCHSQIVQGSHMTVTEETCFLCHFKDQLAGAEMTGCILCHHAPAASDSANVIFDHTILVAKNVDCRLCHGKMAVGEGEVSKERCSYCHAEAGKLEQYSQTVKLHQIHITQHKVECNHCHNTILHRSIARTGAIKPDCQECHVDRHLAQYSLFSGQGAEGVVPQPSAMFHAGLGCKACHFLYPPDWKQHPALATAKAGKVSCSSCHDDSYFKLYEQAKPIILQKIESAQNRLNSVRQKYRSTQADSILNSCSDNLILLKQGSPIHNLNYSDFILQEISLSLDKLEGKKVTAVEPSDSSSKKCLHCHYGQEDISLTYNNKLFSHKIHFQGQKLTCSACHYEEKPHHGKIKPGGYCMDCHHQSAAVSCDPCHSVQNDLFQASGPFADYAPDAMSDAGLTCRDCHKVTGKKVKKPSSEVCDNCHEPGYWDSFVQNRAINKQMLDQLSYLIKLDSLNPEIISAKKLISALIWEGAAGAHNLQAAQQILLKIKRQTESSALADTTAKQ